MPEKTHHNTHPTVCSQITLQILSQKFLPQVDTLDHVILCCRLPCALWGGKQYAGPS